LSTTINRPKEREVSSSSIGRFRACIRMKAMTRGRLRISVQAQPRRSRRVWEGTRKRDGKHGRQNRGTGVVGKAANKKREY